MVTINQVQALTRGDLDQFTEPSQTTFVMAASTEAAAGTSSFLTVTGVDIFTLSDLIQPNLTQFTSDE